MHRIFSVGWCRSCEDQRKSLLKERVCPCSFFGAVTFWEWFVRRMQIR
uniref:Uncharacterized protein n=1 Tax=Rhizophora mucronata TaxID=61149 RepID=A0A2P2PXY1_RHIMU